MKFRAFVVSVMCLAIVGLSSTVALAGIILRPHWRPSW
jgi:hypothetical protein